MEDLVFFSDEEEIFSSLSSFTLRPRELQRVAWTAEAPRGMRDKPHAHAMYVHPKETQRETPHAGHADVCTYRWTGCLTESCLYDAEERERKRRPFCPPFYRRKGA